MFGERIVKINPPSPLRALLARHDKGVQALALGLRTELRDLIREARRHAAAEGLAARRRNERLLRMCGARLEIDADGAC